MPSDPTVATDEALDRWYKRYDGRSDTPGVRVWMPTSLPNAYLLTTSHGCQQPDTLNPGPPMVHVRVGGVEFGGYLDDMEVLFAATVEAIGYVRRQYLEMCGAEGREPEVPFHVKIEREAATDA